MLTVMVHAKAKAAQLGEFVELAALLTRETLGKRPGCITYAFNQSVDAPTEFVLCEQWESQARLDAHMRALCDLLGPPKPGGILPARLLAMYESAKPVAYRVIGTTTGG